MSEEYWYYKKLTVTGAVTGNKNVVLGSIVIGTDGVNEPVITVYDGAANTDPECVPTATQPAGDKGWFGLIHYNCLCWDGIYVEITCAGTVEVVVLWRPAGQHS